MVEVRAIEPSANISGGADPDAVEFKLVDFMNNLELLCDVHCVPTETYRISRVQGAAIYKLLEVARKGGARVEGPSSSTDGGTDEDTS